MAQRLMVRVTTDVIDLRMMIILVALAKTVEVVGMIADVEA